MISVQPYTDEVINNYRGFFLLRSIEDVSEIKIVHHTPAGYIETDVADAFLMPNKKVLIAWRPPLHLSPMHNLVAISGQTTEIINLFPLERAIDIYDRPVDAQAGVFTFTSSDMIIAPNLDWRCDNGKFGPRSFLPITIIDELPQIVMYEPILSINGVGHLIYMEGVGKQTLADEHLNNDLFPVTGRTLWEALKLIREWSIVKAPPFNNTDSAALKAFQFMDQLKFTEQELLSIDSQVPMQIANYLTGNLEARKRPANILPLNNEVKNMVFRRLASSSISALEYLNSGMVDLNEVLLTEKQTLDRDVAMFSASKNGNEHMPFVPMYERFLLNKQTILDKVAAGQL